MKHKYLNKNTSLMIHGIAILMMIYHHAFVSGNTWHNGNPTTLLSIFDPINIGLAPNTQQTFAWFCRVCVSLFAFTSGYAMYIQFENKVKNELDIKGLYQYCFKRIWSFYKKYFLAFIIFSSCEWFMGNPNGLDFTVKNYLLTMLGIYHTFNDTWWYVAQYYLMVLASPIAYIILKRIKFRDYLILISAFVLSIVLAFVMGNGIIYLKTISAFIQKQWLIILLIFMEGMFIARYNILDFICEKLNLITALILLVITYLLRAMLLRAPSDPLFDLVLIVPLVISFSKLLSYIKNVSKILLLMGKHSTHMWFNHTYFYAYLFFDLVYPCDASILVFVQIVLYSLATAIIFAQIERIIHLVFNKKTSSN